MPLTSISTKLKRIGKVYHQGEFLIGSISIDNKYELNHNGIWLNLEGDASMHFNLRGVSFIDNLYGSNKTINLMKQQLLVRQAGKLEVGKTEIPFKLLVDANIGEGQDTLYETYHGFFISIQYALKCCIKRPFFVRDITQSCDFTIEYDPEPIGAPALIRDPLKFELSSDKLQVEVTQNGLELASVTLPPEFKLIGELDSSTFLLNQPITGQFEIQTCECVIRSVELQLLRVETCNSEGEFSQDTSEVQNIQLGEGNLLRKVPIPIYMILPRLFTCPTLQTEHFTIEFELKLNIIFNDFHMITKRLPIKLMRSTIQPINFT